MDFNPLVWRRFLGLIVSILLESDFLADCFGQILQHLFVILENLIVLQKKGLDLVQLAFHVGELPSCLCEVS